MHLTRANPSDYYTLEIENLQYRDIAPLQTSSILKYYAILIAVLLFT